MGSHSVTCHPTEVRIPPLPPAEAGTRFSDPGGMQGWVDLCYVKATGWELNPRPVNRKSNALPPSHRATSGASGCCCELSYFKSRCWLCYWCRTSPVSTVHTVNVVRASDGKLTKAPSAILSTGMKLIPCLVDGVVAQWLGCQTCNRGWRIQLQRGRGCIMTRGKWFTHCAPSPSSITYYESVAAGALQLGR